VFASSLDPVTRVAASEQHGFAEGCDFTGTVVLCGRWRRYHYYLLHTCAK